MKLDEIFVLNEGASVVWQRTNGKFKKLWRSTSGDRKGRLFTSPEDCDKPGLPDKIKQISRTPVMERLEKVNV
jgi:hypothetical protein